MNFRQLNVGQTFDFIDDVPGAYHSFYRACRKISARRYIDTQGLIYNVGSIYANVYHVGRDFEDERTETIAHGHHISNFSK